MFIGHFGLALGAKKAVPAVALGPLFAAWRGWAMLFGAIYVGLSRARLSAFVTIALLVISHWVLDYVTHRPDMPLTPSGPARLGLGLWNSVPGTLAVELIIFSAGLALYLRATTARDRIGAAGFWTLIAFLLPAY